MKVISATNVNAHFKHTFTMHKQEQGTPHITATPKHALFPPYAVNEKTSRAQQESVVDHQANQHGWSYTPVATQCTINLCKPK